MKAGDGNVVRALCSIPSVSLNTVKDNVFHLMSSPALQLCLANRAGHAQEDLSADFPGSRSSACMWCPQAPQLSGDVAAARLPLLWHQGTFSVVGHAQRVQSHMSLCL